MKLEVRSATPADAAAIAEIYNQGMEERQATFETRPRTPSELERDIEQSDLPFLVAVRGDDVLGWARIYPYSERECYAGVGEASLYVAREARGAGVGRRLADALADAARRAGHWKIIGLLFPENKASVALFRARGYREVGVYRRHGRLEGEWRDVLIVERALD
jgi:phosphinothricin acetyltransferase